jgi:sorting nexin-29
MISIYTKLFNLVLNSGIFPKDWSIGIIKPLYKNKGCTTDPNNYRGITLLSCFGKLFTGVLNERLKKFIEVFETVGEEQTGFRNGHSTLDNLFTLYGIIDILLFKKKRLYCAFFRL